MAARHAHLAQWATTVKGFCDALGIEKPIVLGGSFGGFVAQSYATRHPEHPAKLISGTPRRSSMRRCLGVRAGRRQGARDVAEPYWLEPTMERRIAYLEKCFRSTIPGRNDPNALKRAILVTRSPCVQRAAQRAGRGLSLRISPRVACPTLVLAGDQRPDRSDLVERDDGRMLRNISWFRKFRELRARRAPRRP